MCDEAKRARFSTGLRQRLTELRREEVGSEEARRGLVVIRALGG
jgi:hypothetical protein